MIRQLPSGYALIIRGGYPPTIARLPRAWNNLLYRRARHMSPSAELLTETCPASPLRSRRSWPEIPDHVPDDLLGDDEQRWG